MDPWIPRSGFQGRQEAAGEGGGANEGSAPLTLLSRAGSTPGQSLPGAMESHRGFLSGGAA